MEGSKLLSALSISLEELSSKLNGKIEVPPISRAVSSTGSFTKPTFYKSKIREINKKRRQSDKKRRQSNR